LVDPAKRLVARELESRWNSALERVDQLERRIQDLETEVQRRPEIDRDALLALAHDLPAAWNAPSTDPRTKQRLTRILIQEVVIDDDQKANQTVLIIHWTGGRHTEARVAKVRTGRYPDDSYPSPVEVMRTLGGHWPDRELAVTMNRMRCKSGDGKSWTVARVRELRERLGIAAFDPTSIKIETITIDEAAHRLNICVGSVKRLIREGVLPATQLMPSAPWQIPASALDTEAVKIGVRAVMERRPSNFTALQDLKTLKLPGF
jgi:excisionase family DNA binding protein